VEFGCYTQAVAHRPHVLGEGLDGAEQRRLLEVTEHLVTVGDRPDVLQRGPEEGRQVICLAASSDRRDDLIETQVGEEVGLFQLIGGCADLGSVEEDAAEWQGEIDLLSWPARGWCPTVSRRCAGGPVRRSAARALPAPRSRVVIEDLPGTRKAPGAEPQKPSPVERDTTRASSRSVLKGIVLPS
jgi:hypothetical protein